MKASVRPPPAEDNGTRGKSAARRPGRLFYRRIAEISVLGFDRGGGSKCAGLRNWAAYREATKGTARWHFDRIESGAPTAFLDDLLLNQVTGVSQDQFDKVRRGLGMLVNQSAGIPDRLTFRKPLLAHLQKMESLSTEWNFPKGSGQENAAHREIVDDGLDLEITSGFYKAIASLVEKSPDVLKNPVSWVARFSKHTGGKL